MADRYFDRLGPTLLVALMLYGAYYRQPSLAALATTLLFTLLATRFWSRHALHAVGYQRETSDDRAFPGDELQLTLRLANHKLLPLPWVEVDDQIPPSLGLSAEREMLPLETEKGRLRLAGSVGWYERLHWRYRLRCRRRGIYPLGPATVTSGDPFGLFPHSSKIGNVGRVVVYPRLLPLERLGLPAGFPLGERKPERWIFEDPSRPAGIRDYRREDPFHQIHWKATARRQQLQVKLHEPTTTLETAIFLGVESFDPQDSALRFEYAVSLAASLAHWLIEQRHPVGLYLNGGVAGSQEPSELAPGGSQEQLIQILELLAAVQPVSSDPVELLLGRTASRLPWGTKTILVAGGLSESLAAGLESLARSGKRGVVFVVGEKPLIRTPEGIELYIRQPTVEERTLLAGGGEGIGMGSR